MSDFYLPLRTLNPLTRSFACKLVDSAYTYSAQHTTLSDVTTLGDPVYLTRTGSTVSGVITYDPSDPIFTSVPASDEANAIVVYDFNTEELYAYASSDTIEVKSMAITVIINASGLVTITADTSTVDWTLQKFNEASGADYNSVYSQSAISTLAESLPLAIIPFTKFTTGTIVGVQANPIIYDKQTNGTDYNKAYTKEAIQAIVDVDSSPLSICTFTKFDTGTIYAFDRNPTVIDTTATYDVTETIPVPILSVTRNVTTAEINYLNRPTGYRVRLFRGDSLRGSKIPTTNIDESLSNSFSDAGLDATKNYKYYAKFVAQGTINGNVVSVVGSRGQAATTIPENALIL